MTRYKILFHILNNYNIQDDEELIRKIISKQSKREFLKAAVREISNYTLKESEIKLNKDENLLLVLYYIGEMSLEDIGYILEHSVEDLVSLNQSIKKKLILGNFVDSQINEIELKNTICNQFAIEIPETFENIVSKILLEKRNIKIKKIKTLGFKILLAFIIIALISTTYIVVNNYRKSIELTEESNNGVKIKVLKKYFDAKRNDLLFEIEGLTSNKASFKISQVYVNGVLDATYNTDYEGFKTVNFERNKDGKLIGNYRFSGIKDKDNLKIIIDKVSCYEDNYDYRDIKWHYDFPKSADIDGKWVIENIKLKQDKSYKKIKLNKSDIKFEDYKISILEVRKYKFTYNVKLKVEAPKENSIIFGCFNENNDYLNTECSDLDDENTKNIVIYCNDDNYKELYIRPIAIIKPNSIVISNKNYPLELSNYKLDNGDFFEEKILSIDYINNDVLIKKSIKSNFMFDSNSNIIVIKKNIYMNEFKNEYDDELGNITYHKNDIFSSDYDSKIKIEKEDEIVFKSEQVMIDNEFFNKLKLKIF